MARSFWMPHQDAKLLRLREKGCSPSQIAAALCTTRGAVIGRVHRLLGTTFTSSVERAAKSRKESLAKKELRRKDEQRALAQMRKDLDRGMERDKAIVRARKAGARFSTLGAFFGLTSQAAHITVKRYLAARG
jgi:hypothetical protein